jgi:hypothetical protein
MKLQPKEILSTHASTCSASRAASEQGGEAAVPDRPWDACRRLLDGSPAELQFLTHAAACYFGMRGADDLQRSASRNPDWTGMVSLAQEHAMLPLLYRVLTRVPIPAPPAIALATLRSTYLAHAGQCQFQIGELLRLLSALEERRIPCLAIKGPALASQAYGEVTLRRYTDLDILCHPADVEKAEAAILRRGFLGGKSDNAEQNDRNDGQRIYHQRGLLLELHWTLAPRHYAFDLGDAIWQRSGPVDIAGTPVLTPAPEEALLLACFHGYNHHWNRLSYVCDVAALIARFPGMDWEHVVAQARRTHAARILGTSLYLAQGLLGVAAPDALQAALAKDRGARRVGTAAARPLLRDPDAATPPVFHREILRIAGRERMRERCVYLAYRLRQLARPNARDRAAVRLPRGLRALQYLLRPLRLARVYLLPLARRPSRPKPQSAG